MEEAFKAAKEVEKWLGEERNVPVPVAAAVAPALFELGYIYPSTLLNIPRDDLSRTIITPPYQNLLFNKLQQQQQQQASEDDLTLLPEVRDIENLNADQPPATPPDKIL